MRFCLWSRIMALVTEERKMNRHCSNSPCIFPPLKKYSSSSSVSWWGTDSFSLWQILKLAINTRSLKFEGRHCLQIGSVKETVWSFSWLVQYSIRMSGIFYLYNWNKVSWTMILVDFYHMGIQCYFCCPEIPCPRVWNYLLKWNFWARVTACNCCTGWDCTFRQAGTPQC